MAISNENASRVIEKSEYYNKAMYAASLNEQTAEEEKAKTLADKKAKKEGGGKVFIATGSRDKLIKLWDAKEGRQVITFAGHDNWVRDVIFHPNGKYLLSASDDKSIRVWDLTTGRCLKKITDAHGHFVSCIDISEKYWICASGSVDNSIKLWDCN